MAPTTPAKTTSSGFGRTLGARIFLVSGALIALSVGAAVVFTALRSGAIARQAVSRALEASQSAQAGFEQQRITQLRLISRVVAGDPAFVAYVAEGDQASVFDLLRERRAALGCDFAIVLDPRGRVLARTDRAGDRGQDLSSRPLIATAMSAGEAVGLWREGDRLFTVVAVSLLSGAQLPEGILVTGFAIDDALALDVKKVSGTEVAYLVTNGGPHLAASTLGERAGPLLDALRSRPEVMAEVARGEPVARVDLPLVDRAWVARIIPLREPGGGTVGAAVTLASLDDELAPFSRIESTLISVGLIAMLLAFALSYWLSRRITRPIERLARAAESARGGEYGQRVEVGGSDEVARLARAFAELLADLREQRELQAYLGELSRQLPETGTATGRPEPAQAGAALPAGTVVGKRFEILSTVGAGGMGVVYKARDRQLNDIVALKMLRSDSWGDADALDRLKSELRLARRVTHRHVLRTHDFGEIDGVAFISMEFVRGVTLRHMLTHSGRLPASAGLRLARQLCSGLEAAHATGVLHRDIKPENVVLEPSGNAKLMDFGIARPTRSGPSGGPGLDLSGTPQYLAPERLRGLEGDARSDLYSFGVLLYEMFTGRLPFAGGDPDELAYRQMNQVPPPLRSVVPELPEALEKIVLHCLERDPERRYARASALLHDLEMLSVA